MKALCLRYLAWFGALKPRERNMVVVAALGLAAFIPYTLLLDPALRESRRLTTQVENQSRTLAAIQTDVAALAKANVDPDQVSRERVTDLTRQLRSLDEAMRRSQKGLVPADQMAKLLGNLLDRGGGLRIVALRTLPATPLLDRGVAPGGTANPAAPGAVSPAAAAVASVVSAASGAVTPAAGGGPASAAAGAAGQTASASAVPSAGIFKHGVELVLQGSYAELSAYLERIERSPAQMFWARAVLDAEAYPQLTLTVSLFTIGLEATWLSV